MKPSTIREEKFRNAQNALSDIINNMPTTSKQRSDIFDAIKYMEYEFIEANEAAEEKGV